MTLRLWPTRRQWQRWQLPSKATFIGTVVAILMGVFAILTYLFGSSPQVSQEGSGNIHMNGVSVQGNPTLGNNITATASQGGIAVNNTGSGRVYIGVSEERFQRLAEELGVTRAALKNFFHNLEQREVPPEELDRQLRAIAQRYHELREKWKVFSTDDATIVALKQEAGQALERGDFARVEQLLNQASERDVEAAKQLQETATKRLLSAAASKAEIGTLKLIELAYRDAAAYFRHAVDLVPQDAPLTRADYLNNCGAALVWAGDYAEARLPLVNALQIRERVLGPEHPDVALSLSNLASLHVEQDHYSQAEPLARRALHINDSTVVIWGSHI